VAAEIQRLRVERAKRLLADSELAVKNVAVRSGFANAQRLDEAFRRSEGISPGQFRQRMATTRR
jgi:transcriptional regulator GlxA family with amidase domain